MKINVILPNALQRGGTLMTLEYLSYFSSRGEDVEVYVPLFGPRESLNRLLAPISLVRNVANPKYRGNWFGRDFSLRFSPDFDCQRIRSADVTIATYWLTSYWVSKLADAQGAHVYFIQGFETWFDKVTNERVVNSYRLPFDLRVSVSSQLQSKLMQEVGSESVVIRNGIQGRYISNSLHEHSNHALTIGMPWREARTINNDVKNCTVGLQALQALIKSSGDFEVRCFGFKQPNWWPDEIPFLENPTRDELFRWYDSIDVLYVPSLYEGWGLPASEAMASLDLPVTTDEYRRNFASICLSASLK